jgi:heme/copper-type cytochrome/quinol oxidase subunit 4
MGGGGWTVSIIATVIVVALILAAVIWIVSDRGARRE